MRLGLRKLTWPGLVVMVGTLAVMLAGCGSTSSNGGILPDSQQIITLPIDAGAADISTLDPATATDLYSTQVLQLIFPALIVLDANNNIQPWAATALPTFDSSTNSYTFHVRPGMKWSDGQPLDANTFAYSINRSISPCTASNLASYMFGIKNAAAFNAEHCASDGTTVTGAMTTLIGTSITVPDNNTLVITLTGPAPYFLDAMTFSTFYAQPQQLISKYGNKDWINHIATPTGFGGNLFNLTTWDHSGHVDFVRNPGFWGTAPKASKLNLDIYQTANTEYAQYLDGKLPEAAAPAAQYKQSKARSDFHEIPVLGIGFAQPNWNKLPFSNLNARQAFAIALDKQVLNDTVLAGQDFATNHIVPVGMPGYDTSLVGPDGTTSLTGNTAKATQLFDAYASSAGSGCKGYVAGSDKFSSCPSVTVWDTNSPTGVTELGAMVQMWQNAFPGLVIKTNFVDFSTLIKVTEGAPAGDPQMFLIGWGADYPDPQDWTSLQFSPTASNNWGYVNLPAANTLMAEADVNQDPTSRYAQYNQAEQLLVTNVAWIPLDQNKEHWSVQPYLHNFSYNAFQYNPMTSFQDMYLTAH